METDMIQSRVVVGPWLSLLMKPFRKTVAQSRKASDKKSQSADARSLQYKFIPPNSKKKDVVEVENIITGEKKSFPVTVLKLFFGETAAAFKAAKIDQKQHDDIEGSY